MVIANNTILCVESISKSFSNVKVVNDISFIVNQGDIFAFLQTNGAGKKSTVRMFPGIIKSGIGRKKHQTIVKCT